MTMASDTETRMRWWRKARFGLFLHWGPASILGVELSWDRKARKPLDITGDPAGAGVDPVYDALPQQFNPTKFNAQEWVQMAQDAGMNYLVFTCKHHDGFAMFDTALSDYKITNTPFGRDIVRELSDACHAKGMKFGMYYSQRDWHYPDYGIGDNSAYAAYMQGQVRELLTHYGKVDILWFDSYGYGDLRTFWRVGELWDMIHQLQPEIVVNNRLAVLADYNQQPAEWLGDFDTPEERMGTYQIDRNWESCLCLVGHQWSYKPDGEMMSFGTVVTALASAATGDGNLLLNIGPMPTGEIEPRQADRLREVGVWLREYGQTIYGTRGGPWPGGAWGGATYQANLIFLHILDWPGDTLHLPPFPITITAARALTGGDVQYAQSAGGISLTLPRALRDPIDTIIELTLERPITSVEISNANKKHT